MIHPYEEFFFNQNFIQSQFRASFNFHLGKKIIGIWSRYRVKPTIKIWIHFSITSI